MRECESCFREHKGSSKTCPYCGHIIAKRLKTEMNLNAIETEQRRIDAKWKRRMEKLDAK